MEELMIITSYFPPEIGAASNRIYHLAEGLRSSYKVSVVTPLPNYPTGRIFSDYKGKYKSKTLENGIEVNRIWLYASKSKNKFIRLFAMLSYSISLVWFFTWNKIPKKVIVQSPPLLVAFTCMFFLRSKKRKLILNVSDLWPSAGLELGALKNNFSYSILKKLEQFNYKNADLILGQSNEILSHIEQITKKPELFLYRNYPNIPVNNISENHSDTKKIKIVYAGLLGVAQGILKLCENLDYDNIELHIYGSGAEEEDVKSYIETNKELPIFFYGRVDRSVLHQELKKYDVAIIPLLNRIYGSVPSKIFEYAKLGLPMLYFGGGEGESVISKHKLGWIAEAGNYTELNSIINSIKKSDITIERKKAIQATAYTSFDLTAQLNGLKGKI
ncbi:glycosyltransferase family 4 protein [Winogradskyella ouciana]|uniref:Glycosyltransferase n=1 Tax=Winogradskyella ouciana TaxID=2608631 RepID=A0A7K1GH64_9FLAO|nr:glycosyltransferase family 4 protein [Winogradskyella ouciana]MTE27219.1 glycosyltransferase [Winogradskyella ouciana]